MAAQGGTGLAVGGSLAGSVPGILLGISAALIYSVYILVGERVTPVSGAMASATVIMLAAAAVCGLAVLVRGAAFPSSAVGWAAAGSIAVLSTAVAVISFFAGMARLGAADAATLSTLEPVVSMVLAAMFLDEALAQWQIVGGAIVLGAVILLARSGDARR